MWNVHESTKGRNSHKSHSSDSDSRGVNIPTLKRLLQPRSTRQRVGGCGGSSSGQWQYAPAARMEMPSGLGCWFRPFFWTSQYGRSAFAFSRYKNPADCSLPMTMICCASFELLLDAVVIATAEGSDPATVGPGRAKREPEPADSSKFPPYVQTKILIVPKVAVASIWVRSTCCRCTASKFWNHRFLSKL
jgi:hypothetical protein